MVERWLGLVVSGGKIAAVEAEVPSEGPLVVQADLTWGLQKGDRPSAYCVMHRHIADYISENRIARVVVKASAISKSATLAHLEAAELRGVVLSAAASVAKTVALAKANVSRTFGERKADEYIADASFWGAEVTGANLRGGSREAAFMLLAARKSQ